MNRLIGKDEYLTSLENRMGLHAPASSDAIKRSDFPDGPAGDDAYCEACARRDLALEKDPRLVDLKRKINLHRYMYSLLLNNDQAHIL